MIETNNSSLVAFIDILGFRSIVNDYFSGKNKESYIKLEEALKASEACAIETSKNYLKKYEIDFCFKQFSDCVSISMPINEKRGRDFIEILGCFLNIVRLYNYILLDNNILVRGGISVGQHIENNNMIFSEALIQSYKLESENAIYPRILIDRDLLKLIEDKLKESSEFYGDFDSLCGCNMIKDWDGEIFVSPLGLYREAQKSYMNKTDDELIDQLSNSPLVDKKLINISDIRARVNNKSDKDLVKELLERTNKYIRENLGGKTEIILKHKWLQQFFLWYIDKDDSDIKFQQYLLNPIKK